MLLITIDRVVLDIVKSVLKTYRVVCSDDSRAMLVFGSCMPDVVLLDFVCVDRRVEKMRIRLLKRIWKISPSTPVVLLGLRDHNSVRAELESRSVYYLPKLTRSAILREVCRHINNKR